MLLAGQVADLWRAAARRQHPPAAPRLGGGDATAPEAAAVIVEDAPAPHVPRLERLLKRVRGIFAATPPPAA
jgi:hypothetical protein